MPFRYYQKGERTAWLPHKYAIGEDWEQQVRAKGAKKVTILALERPVDEYDDGYGTLQYSGPFYMDIDVKPEEVNSDEDRALEVAIESTLGIVNELMSHFKVLKRNIHIYLSGKKGCHITVPASVFSAGNPEVRLPKIYKHMASYFLMPGVDYQVYSEGKGVSWRLTEIIREGTDIKRTAITYDELRELTPAIYREIVKTPRDFKHPLDTEPAQPSKAFKQHFSRCKLAVQAETNASEDTPLTDEDLSAIADRPPCIKLITSDKDLKVRSFNSSAMQVMIYLASTNQNASIVSDTINAFTTVRTSSRFGSAMDARKSLKDIYHSVKNSNKRFGCGYIRSAFTVPKGMCSGCALTDKKKGQSGLLHHLAHQKEGTYIVNVENNTKQLVFPGFHVVAEAELLNQDGQISGIAIAATNVKTGRTRRFTLEAEDYISPIPFVRSLRMHGLVVSGTVLKFQADIMAWFQMEIRASVEEVDTVEVVKELGLYTTRKGKAFWITPEFTLENNGMRNTVHLDLPQAGLFTNNIWGGIKPPSDHDTGDKRFLGEAILASLTIRDTAVTGTLLGWMMGCWLNPYLKTLAFLPPEYPILRITGTTGTGKSTLIQHFVHFTGLTNRISLMFGGAGAGSSLVGGSHAMTSSKSLPIVWEEVNATSQESSYATKLRDFLEAVKNSWNGDQIVKSTGVGSSGVSSFAMTNPTVLLGEVDASTESLNHRSIWLYLDSLVTERGQGYQEAFTAMESKRFKGKSYKQVLPTLADFMFFYLAELSEEQLRVMVDDGRQYRLRDIREYAAEKGVVLDARKAIAIACVLQGIDLLVKVALHYDILDKVGLKRLESLPQDVMRYQLGIRARDVTDSRIAGSDREHVGQVRLTDAQKVLKTLIALAKQKMGALMLLNKDNFRPVEEGELGMFHRVDGYLVLNKDTAYACLKRMRNKDVLNFATSSSADFTSRLSEMRDSKSTRYEDTNTDIAISLESIANQRIADVEDFEKMCDKYLNKLYVYNPELQPAPPKEYYDEDYDNHGKD